VNKLEYTWCDYEVLGMTLLRDLKEAMHLGHNKDISVHVQLVLVTI